MLELIDGNHLVMNEYYYVKCRKENRHVQFLEYDSIGCVNFAVCLCMNHIVYLYTGNLYYKYISKKDFFEKMKKKYDAKCLDIVLKRLVNENFEW